MVVKDVAAILAHPADIEGGGAAAIGIEAELKNRLQEAEEGRASNPL